VAADAAHQDQAYRPDVLGLGFGLGLPLGVASQPADLLQLLATFVTVLLGAEADGVCGAGYHARTPERVNSRSGCRHQQLDTRDPG
jgi:hypothetical protein